MNCILMSGFVVASVVAGQSSERPYPIAQPAPLVADSSPRLLSQNPAQAPPQSPQPAPFPSDARIGIVVMQTLVSDSKLGKAGQDRMKALTDRREADLQRKDKGIQTLQQQIDQQSSVLAAPVLAQKRSDLEKLQRAAQFSLQDWNAQVQSLQDELLSDFQTKVLAVVESVRADRDLWVIYVHPDSGTVAYKIGTDLTAEIIKRLDAKFPTGK
jgi:Skp family chaperone for outer membrane proteins